MKTLHIQLLITIILTCAYSLHAQQPTKEEIEEMKKAMKEMKADPEMMEAMKKMGMDMKMVEDAMNAVEKNGTVAYYELDEFQTPKKDNARISALPKTILTNDALTAYLQKTEKQILPAFPEDERKLLDQLHNKVKAYHPDTLTAIANGLWMSANYIPAAYLMGKACQRNPNADNMNNYSAFLIMLGGEELALPLLHKLNKQYPKNSTILNNLGQAWFGLGDLDQAGKYLDSTIRIYRYHPQANLTKAVIQKSKGDQAGAVESLKNSMKGGYSSSKEAMLRKLGYKDNGKELAKEYAKDFHMPQDPLGFDKWIAKIPAFPKSYEEQIRLESEWKALYAAADKELPGLREKSRKLNEEYAKKELERANPMASAFRPPYLSTKMQKIMDYYMNDKDGHWANEAKQLADQISALPGTLEQIKKEYDTKWEAIRKKYSVEGEGIKGPEGDECAELKTLFNQYLSKANSEREKVFFADLKYRKKRLEANAYCYQFITDNQAMIDFVETNCKIEFLIPINSSYGLLKPQLGFGDLMGCLETEEEKAVVRKLAEWNDLHCDRNVTYKFPFTGTMKFTCNETELHLDPLLLPFEYHYKENLNTNEMLFCSGKIGMGPAKAGGEYDVVNQTGKIEVGYSKDLGKDKFGPLTVEGSVEATAGIEFDKSGVTDFVLDAGIEAKSGNKAGSISVSGNARWGWNAGGSGDFKGALGGASARAVQDSK